MREREVAAGGGVQLRRRHSGSRRQPRRGPVTRIGDEGGEAHGEAAEKQPRAALIGEA
jgi:hypothetical protein